MIAEYIYIYVYISIGLPEKHLQKQRRKGPLLVAYHYVLWAFFERDFHYRKISYRYKRPWDIMKSEHLPLFSQVSVRKAYGNVFAYFSAIY